MKSKFRGVGPINYVMDYSMKTTPVITVVVFWLSRSLFQGWKPGCSRHTVGYLLIKLLLLIGSHMYDVGGRDECIML